jgi:hypothetical protein
MLPAGFEAAVSTSERPLTNFTDRAATGTDIAIKRGTKYKYGALVE